MECRGDISRLNVILTADCNLRCSYCFQDDKKARRMPWDVLRASADLLLGSRRPEVTLVFTGGEPLLEFPLVRRVVGYVERNRPAAKTVRYELITNGTLLDEEQIEFLAGHGFALQLSLDGVAAAQDLRGTGTHATLGRLLDRLRAVHPGFFRECTSVSLTLVPGTVRWLAESIAYLLSRDVQAIGIAPAVTPQPGWRRERIRALDRQFARVFRLSLDHYRRTGDVPLALFRKEAADCAVRRRPSSMCGVGRAETPAVDVDGLVHGCVMFAGSYQTFRAAPLARRVAAMAMGDVAGLELAGGRATYTAALAESGVFDGRQHKHSGYGRCRDCRFLFDCAVCPMAIAYQPGGDPRRIPDFVCAYNRVSLHYRSRFPPPPDARSILLGRASIPELTRELVACAGEHQADAVATRLPAPAPSAEDWEEEPW